MFLVDFIDHGIAKGFEITFVREDDIRNIARLLTFLLDLACWHVDPAIATRDHVLAVENR